MNSKTKKSEKVYDLVCKKPVARFYYQGEHSHPVRRTILVIEDRKDVLTGYEFREGSTVRTAEQALKTIKSYRKDKIARWGDYSRLRMSSTNFLKNPQASTLERLPLVEMFAEGV